ncbi:hypothetical protein [Pyrococcus sp. ST04]|uniref:hypothetical protein n=1 Tax=Pyrococcus sp. ST04 TaxID=1183377 RepID=UPI0002605AA5|nr:hypothetical protein [Pyrococcus sp. ST04]AFK22102.1 hypothetical protein Py04_0500 [Pyrococcus sp. ST04]
MKLVRVALGFYFLYEIVNIVKSVREVENLIGLGLQILGIPLSTDEFFLLLTILLAVGFALSEKSLQSLASTLFMLNSFLWLLNSPIMRENFPTIVSIFQAFLPEEEWGTKVITSVLLLMVAFIVDIYSKYEDAGLKWEDSSIGFLYSLIPIGIGVLVFDIFKERVPRLTQIPGEYYPVLILILALSFYLLAYGRTKDVVTVVKVNVPVNTEFRVENGKIIVIPKSGPREVKVEEFKGKYEAYIEVKGIKTPLKKVMDFSERGKRIIVYSNEEMIKI